MGTATDLPLGGGAPWLVAASHVLLRFQAPRHPPLALCSLENKDARARYGILKGRAAPRRLRFQWGRAVRKRERSTAHKATVGFATGATYICHSLKTE